MNHTGEMCGFRGCLSATGKMRKTDG